MITDCDDRNQFPIFLSAGGRLHSNSTDNKLYSNDRQLLEIFPDLCDKVLDPAIEAKLQELNITCEMNLQEFLCYLEKFYPDYCSNRIIEVESDFMPDLTTRVCRIWDFFSNLREKLPSIEEKIQKLSILFCKNRKDEFILQPIFNGRILVFQTLESIKIGPVVLQIDQFDCFFELVPELKLRKSDSCTTRLVSEYIFNNQSDPFVFLNILHTINVSHGFESIDETSRNQLGNYFYDYFSVNLSKLDSEYAEIMRSLPLHLSLNGKLQPLAGPKTIYALPKQIQLIGDFVEATLADRFIPEEESVDRIPVLQKLGVVLKKKWSIVRGIHHPQDVPTV